MVHKKDVYREKLEKNSERKEILDYGTSKHPKLYNQNRKMFFKNTTSLLNWRGIPPKNKRTYAIGTNISERWQVSNENHQISHPQWGQVVREVLTSDCSGTNEEYEIDGNMNKLKKAIDRVKKIHLKRNNNVKKKKTQMTDGTRQMIKRRRLFLTTNEYKYYRNNY